MPLITIIVTLIAIGIILWAINTYIPLQASIKQILNGVVIIIVVLWLLKAFGILSMISNIHT